jgi:hypothetical protein
MHNTCMRLPRSSLVFLVAALMCFVLSDANICASTPLLCGDMTPPPAFDATFITTAGNFTVQPPTLLPPLLPHITASDSLRERVGSARLRSLLRALPPRLLLSSRVRRRLPVAAVGMTPCAGMQTTTRGRSSDTFPALWCNGEQRGAPSRDCFAHTALHWLHKFYASCRCGSVVACIAASCVVLWRAR